MSESGKVLAVLLVILAAFTFWVLVVSFRCGIHEIQVTADGERMCKPRNEVFNYLEGYNEGTLD